MVTFPKKPVRGFSLKGELGADVFVLLRRPLLLSGSHKKHYPLSNVYDLGDPFIGLFGEVDADEVDEGVVG